MWSLKLLANHKQITCGNYIFGSRRNKFGHIGIALGVIPRFNLRRMGLNQYTSNDSFDSHLQSNVKLN